MAAASQKTSENKLGHARFAPRRFYFCREKSGIALVLVVSVLAIMVTLAVAFLLAARIESFKSIRFREGMKAASIADAGMEHAKALLREDKGINGFDHYGETWKTAFVGDAVDNDGDGTPESKWHELMNASGQLIGRYAVTVTDEASKVNINSAGFYNEDSLKVTEGVSTFEVSLNKLFEALNLGNPVQKRDDILLFRYGGNAPGIVSEDDNKNDGVIASDGMDNDADGDIDEAGEGIDEPQEFDPLYPAGDDEPFLSLSHLKKVASMKSSLPKVGRYLTAYSLDKNTSSNGQLRLDLNQASAMDLFLLLSEKEIENAEQRAVNIVDYRDQDFQQTELVSKEGTFYGAEGLRINELMIRPIYSVQAVTHTNVTGPGGGWTLDGNTFSNSNPEPNGLGGVWWFEELRPGRYYFKVFAAAAGQTVGDVKVNGHTQVSMKHGEVFVDPVEVGVDGRLKVTVSNGEIDTPGFTTRFQSFELSEQPDCEYIELMNITNNPVDLSGWTVEGLRQKDLIAQIPAGTLIYPFDYLVLAVDKDDKAPGVSGNLRDNGICFTNTWQHPEVDFSKVVQLIFSGPVATSDDVITDSPPTDQILTLKDADGNIVERVKYRPSDTATNQAVERDDPLTAGSTGPLHVFNYWNSSDGLTTFLPKGTPTSRNNNLNILGHTFGGIASEVTIKNNYFSSVGELGKVASGASWKRIPRGVLEETADYFCVQSLRLEAEGHAASGSAGGWQEESRAFPKTNWFVSGNAGDEGTWVYGKEDSLQNGLYYLTVYAKPHEALSVSVRRADGSWSDYSPPLISDDQGGVRYGVINIGGASVDATAEKSLEIKLLNMSESGEQAFDYLTLSPLRDIYGRINVNTASPEVLQSLPGVTRDIAGRIYYSSLKPFGDLYGLGDIVEENVLSDDEEDAVKVFQKISNLITVKSDVYEIIVTAEAFSNEKKTATKKVRLVVER